jgi:hypothetical protein
VADACLQKTPGGGERARGREGRPVDPASVEGWRVHEGQGSDLFQFFDHHKEREAIPAADADTGSSRGRDCLAGAIQRIPRAESGAKIDNLLLQLVDPNVTRLEGNFGLLSPGGGGE